MTDSIPPSPAVVDAPAPPDVEPTLAEHRQQFGAASAAAPVDAAVPPSQEVDPAGETPAREDGAPRARDDHGRFQAGSDRGRAAKDVATPADVPRIQALSKQVRDLQAQIEAHRQAQAVAAPAPAAPPPEPSREVRRALPERPNPDAYETYEAYLDARDGYNRAQWTEEQRVSGEAARITASWTSRVDAARRLHEDYDAIALEADTPIPAGSLMDAWILESTQGAELLYALHQDRAECQRIAALPPVQQAEALALLGQRLTASPAGTTGATRTPAPPTVPRPPTPVRTAPMRTGDDLPGDDASLADHRKTWGPRASRR